MKPKKAMTWYELKTFCNSLSGEQLGQEVIVWGDERGFKIQGKMLLEDDYFNPSGDSMEPVSLYKKDPEDWETVKDEPILMVKDSPVLLTDLTEKDGE